MCMLERSCTRWISTGRSSRRHCSRRSKQRAGGPRVPLLQLPARAPSGCSLDALRDLQRGLLRRLLRHAYRHTAHYRTRAGRARHPRRGHRDRRRPARAAAARPRDRRARRSTRARRTRRRTSVITKTTSGTTGQPVVVRYNAESRHWRDATRWRGYGWGGYRIGMRALHYWGFGAADDELDEAQQDRARSRAQARPLRRLHAARRRRR